jgi:hypothetical protein
MDLEKFRRKNAFCRNLFGGNLSRVSRAPSLGAALGQTGCRIHDLARVPAIDAGQPPAEQRQRVVDAQRTALIENGRDGVHDFGGGALPGGAGLNQGAMIEEHP